MSAPGSVSVSGSLLRVWRSISRLYEVPSARERRGLLASALIDSLGSGMILPISLLFLNVVAGQSIRSAGELLSIAAFASIPAGLLAGGLVDRIGPRAVAIFAQLAQGAALIGYLVFRTFAALTATAFVAAVGVAWFWAANTVLVSRVAADEDLHRWFGLETALRNLGFCLGALLASGALAIGGDRSFTVIIAADAGSFFVAALLLSRQQIPSAAPSGQQASAGEQITVGYGAVLRDTSFLGLMTTNVGLLIAVVALPVISTVFIVGAAGYPPSVAGAMFVLNTALITLLQSPVASWVDQHSRRRALQGAALLYVLGAVGLSGYRIEGRFFIPVLALCVILFSLAEMLYSPAMNAEVVSNRPAELVGRYSGAYQLSFSLAFALGPVTLTWLLGISGAVLWLALAAVSAAAAVGVSRWVRG